MSVWLSSLASQMTGMTGMSRASRVPDWAESLNLAGPRVRTASWSWLLLLAGLTAAAWVWPQVEQIEAESVQAKADVQRLQRARHQAELVVQARSHVTPGASAPADASALAPDQAMHAAQVLSWLAFPWEATLQEADEAAVQAQALMLGFSLDLNGWNGQPQTQAWVRMSAAVVDDAAALRWAQGLGAQAQLISRDRLGTPLDTTRGTYTARAELSWPGATP